MRVKESRYNFATKEKNDPQNSKNQFPKIVQIDGGILKSFSAAGSPGFSFQNQIANGSGYFGENIWFFLLCDWKTAWTLLYQPIDEDERKEIDEIMKVRFYFS